MRSKKTWTSFLVEGDGFEPSKSATTDLQSAPFGLSGTPPKSIKLGTYIKSIKLDTYIKIHCFFTFVNTFFIEITEKLL